MPPLYLQVNLVFSGLETSPFSSKCKKGHYGQTLYFYVSFDDKIFLHKARFVLFENCNLAYYDAFGVTASSSLIGLSAYVRAGLVSVWIMKCLPTSHLCNRLLLLLWG
ncbi:hypothetical protein GOODEAATRI_014099 [Goodea atripinnis]|uniref:Uncharacterized protein n=1 Tax=Goodea atripinnis TaxID=208336 RepID=A0ABV0N196_9TELE